MADRPTGRVKYVQGSSPRNPQGYVQPMLEDPGNDAVVAAFTSEEDGETYGPAIERAMDFEHRVKSWLEATANVDIKQERDGGDWGELCSGIIEEARNLLAGRAATDYGTKGAK